MNKPGEDKSVEPKPVEPRPVEPKPAALGRRRRRLAALLLGAVFDNFWLKLVSLLFALGLYGFMHGAANAQRTVQVAVIVDMPPDSTPRHLMSKIPSTVSVTLLGTRQQLDDVRGSQIDPIAIDLRSAQDRQLQLTAAMITGLPPGVTVTRIIPSSLEFRWEAVIDRTVTVQVALTGQLGAGMELRSEVMVDPATVFASGPESRTGVVQLARAQAFDVSGLTAGRHTRLLALDAPPTDVSWSQPSVRATIEVAQKLATKEFEPRVEVVGMPRAKTQPAKVRIVVEGTPERMEGLRSDAVVARVEPKDADGDRTQPGSAMLPVLVDVASASVKLIDPPRVLVKW
jgi:hypothetical protein